MVKPGVKRLIVEVPEKMHHEIKTKASERNITIRKWLTRIIIEALIKEKKYEK